MLYDQIKRVVTGQASEKEKAEVEEWSGGKKDRIHFLKNMSAYYNNAIEPDDTEIKRKMEKLWQKMNPRRRHVNIWRMAGGIAACSIILIGMWTLDKTQERQTTDGQICLNEVQLIRPGGQIHQLGPATAGEDHIEGFIRKGKTLVQKGSASGNKKPEFNEIIVPPQNDYKIILSDGSRITLNSDSHFKFPDSFNGSERRVYLNGEAYFEVARNENRPFLVEFEGGRVEVLGTEFNIRAIEGESKTATLVNGKVKVKSGNNSVTLKPGELCRIYGNSTLETGKADLLSILAWKNNEFVFKDTYLKDIINKVAQWYNVEVEFETADVMQKLNVYMDKPETAEEAFEVLSVAGEFRYKMSADRIVIEK